MGDVVGRGLTCQPWAPGAALGHGLQSGKAACSCSETQIIHVALLQWLGCTCCTGLTLWGPKLLGMVARAPGKEPRDDGAGTWPQAGGQSQ